MSTEICEHHIRLSSDIEVIKNSLEDIKSSFCDYIHEGVKPGGYRERFALLEKEVSALKRAMWGRVIVAGIIGGMIASGSDEAFRVLVKFIVGV